MAKRKVDKETRRLLESVSDLVKKRGDRYKFRTKSKKTIKKIKKTCVHWIIRKGKEVPCVQQDPDRAGWWKCKICGATFPIRPLEDVDGQNQYELKVDEMVQLVNQIQFWSVKLGGDADDTKMFLQLRALLPRFSKVSKQVIKRVNKREEISNSQRKNDAMDQFSMYAGYNYK